jgi:hypothetical protein
LPVRPAGAKVMDRAELREDRVTDEPSDLL